MVDEFRESGPVFPIHAQVNLGFHTRSRDGSLAHSCKCDPMVEAASRLQCNMPPPSPWRVSVFAPLKSNTGSTGFKLLGWRTKDRVEELDHARGRSEVKSTGFLGRPCRWSWTRKVPLGMPVEIRNNG